MRRPWALDKSPKRQDWHNLDMSGQGLRCLSTALFRYEFLAELYIASNKLTSLPAEIGKLRSLRVLEASFNQISELPPELGMCTSLKQLFLFDNQIQDLPHELGSLYKLEMLGIDGNPLVPNLKNEIMERGTKSLISVLRESAPGRENAFQLKLAMIGILVKEVSQLLTFVCSASAAYSTKDSHNRTGRFKPTRTCQGLYLEHPL